MRIHEKRGTSRPVLVPLALCVVLLVVWLGVWPGGGDAVLSYASSILAGGPSPTPVPVQPARQAAPQVVVTLYDGRTPTPTLSPSPLPAALDTMPTATPEPPSTPEPPRVALAKGEARINVHFSPDADSPVLGTLGPGDYVPVTGKNANGLWWQIPFNGRIGWVSASVAPVWGDKSAVMVVPDSP